MLTCFEVKKYYSQIGRLLMPQFIDKNDTNKLIKGDIIIYIIGQETFRKKIISASIMGNTCQLKVRVLGTQTVSDLTLPFEGGKIIFPNNIIGVE